MEDFEDVTARAYLQVERGSLSIVDHLFVPQASAIAYAMEDTESKWSTMI